MIGDIHNLLDALKLRHMRESVAQALEEAKKKNPSYGSFLLKLLQEELGDKRNRLIANRVKNCGLNEYWTLETFPWHIQTCLAKYRKTIEELSELDFIDRGESAIFLGQAGVGKSGLASGILIKALYAGRTGRAFQAQDLFEELGSSVADRTAKGLLKRLCRLDVLVIDEFGYLAPPNQNQINNFFRLMDLRANKKSCIITTNLGFSEWNKFLGSGPLTAALLSRLLQQCHVVTFPANAINLRDPKHKLPARAPLPAILSNS